ncbi:UNVERIFIED_CONTAM: hypothetical protein Scaly_2800100 [Sesamum calycinum]|uniref:Endonuclease/exonuclease/phosphatase domain-containing protein n=1 Tax=Sesamum calycinum TaxID=2727403 RepID=A0AAW2IW82_9LAMI
MEGSMAHADSSQQNKVSRTRGLLTDITNQTVEAAPQPRSPAERNESARLELSRVGNPLTVKGLGDLLRDNKPTLVFLAETKCFASQIEVLKRKFNLFGCNVDPKGRSGGLAILWQKSVDIQLQSFSRYHIDVSVRVKESDEWWRFSGIYGEPDTSKRDHTWRLLRRLHSQSIRPWLCAGDFNEILEHSEKEGGPPRAEWLIEISEIVWQIVNSKTWVSMDIAILGATNNSTHTRSGSDLTELVRAYLGPSYSRGKNPTLNNPLFRPLTDPYCPKTSTDQKPSCWKKIFSFRSRLASGARMRTHGY